MSENVQPMVIEDTSGVEVVQRKPHLRDFLPKTTDKRFVSDVAEVSELRKTDKNAAREKIAEIRGEVSELQQRGIKLQEKFFSAVANDPDISNESLLKFFENDGLNPDEIKIINGMKKELGRKREICVKINSALRKRAVSNLGYGESLDEGQEGVVKSEMAKMLFKAVSGVDPQGDVDLVESDFIVGFKTNSEFDSKKINKNSVGGHHGHDIWIGNLPVGLGEMLGLGLSKNFDYVFISDSFVPGVEKHEVGHGMNSSVMEALKKQGKLADFWGGEQLKFTDNLRSKPVDRASDKVARAFSEYNDGKITAQELEVRTRESMGLVLADVLGKAKDEVLTDFLARGSFDHVESLKRGKFDGEAGLINFARVAEKNTHYDYFSDIGFTAGKFGSSHELREVYNNLASEYNDILAQSVDQMSKFWMASNNFGSQNSYRSKIEGFLRQNPLETWSKRFKLEFGEESEQLIEASKFVSEYQNGIESLKRGLSQGSADSLAKNQGAMWLKEHRGITVDGASMISDSVQKIMKRVGEMEGLVLIDGDELWRKKYDLNKVRKLMASLGNSDSNEAAELFLLKQQVDSVVSIVDDYHKKIREELVRQAREHPLESFFESEDGYMRSRYGKTPGEDLYWKDLMSIIGQLPSIKVDGNRFSDTYSPTSFVFDVAEDRSGESIEKYRKMNPSEATFLETQIVPLLIERRKMQDQITQMNLENDDLRRNLSAKISDYLNPPSAFRGYGNVKREDRFGTTGILDFYDNLISELPEEERRMVLESAETQKRRDLLAAQIKQLDQEMIKKAGNLLNR